MMHSTRANFTRGANSRQIRTANVLQHTHFPPATRKQKQEKSTSFATIWLFLCVYFVAKKVDLHKSYGKPANTNHNQPEKSDGQKKQCKTNTWRKNFSLISFGVSLAFLARNLIWIDWIIKEGCHLTDLSGRSNLQNPFKLITINREARPLIDGEEDGRTGQHPALGQVKLIKRPTATRSATRWSQQMNAGCAHPRNGRS